ELELVPGGLTNVTSLNWIIEGAGRIVEGKRRSQIHSLQEHRRRDRKRIARSDLDAKSCTVCLLRVDVLLDRLRKSCQVVVGIDGIAIDIPILITIEANHAQRGDPLNQRLIK